MRIFENIGFVIDLILKFEMLVLASLAVKKNSMKLPGTILLYKNKSMSWTFLILPMKKG